MNRHQVLTGAVNAGDHCFSVGSVEGVPFTAYAAGCNIVILASNFQRVQIIPGVCHGNVQVSCLDCSTDIGKIAAAYGKKVCIFEPTPLLHQSSPHRLDYKWIQTAAIEADCYVNVLSWNLEGTKLLTGGECIQLWHLLVAADDENIIPEETQHPNQSVGTTNGTLNNGFEEFEQERLRWECVWQCKTAHPVHFLKFSPDGALFTSAGKADRLVKIWYESKKVNFACAGHGASSTAAVSGGTGEVNYTFIYIAHPRAVTGLSWRKTSKYMPRGSVANMLVTSCRDNICRIWIQTLLPDDGLVNLQQIETLANQSPRQQTQRHRQRIMQRLKHMKSFTNFKRRQATQFTEDTHETIPTLPSTYSVHDFHSFGLHGSGVAPGLHFHLASSINAETDIPLVPSMTGTGGGRDPNFVMHWMNNKEMTFTQAAEKMLQELSRKVFRRQASSAADDSDQTDSEDDSMSDHVSKKRNPPMKKSSGRYKKSVSQDDSEDDVRSRHSIPTAQSSASLAADNSTISTSLGDAMDRRIEFLLREWQRGSDLLFSIHPVDGSLLVWLVDWLDEFSPGSYRQPQVSFSSRIPNAIPLGDAATMSHHLALYSPTAGLDLRTALLISTCDTKTPVESPDDASKDAKDQQTAPPPSGSQPKPLPTPSVCMLTKHSNGSLNLWQLGFGENSKFTQVLSIGQAARMCGHRFRMNDISCHPVLPLLITTSHHNVPGQGSLLSSVNSSSAGSPISSPCCPPPSPGNSVVGFCSELVLWKVEPVGPLCKSGGVTELARINSPETAAFANVAWIPTLLPSTTLGSISNSPSACFVASDGRQLRVYQAVIDARTLLAEVSSAERKNYEMDTSLSSSTSSDLGFRNLSLKDAFRIVSLQSTARPGCIIELSAISDATHDWQNTQLLHVFQDQLIKGDRIMASASSGTAKGTEEGGVPDIGLVEPSVQAVVDLRHSAVFEEPFFLVVLEKEDAGHSVLHMWRLLISSQLAPDATQNPPPETNVSYVPDSNLIQEGDHSNQSSRSNSPDLTAGGHTHASPQASPLHISTVKVCTQVLPLPEDVEIVHACPAAGHLSSSNIYPACFAPYLLATACSDGSIRFWRCQVEDGNGNGGEKTYTWVEWEMNLSSKDDPMKESGSTLSVAGQPLYVSCAYSGRVACAYKTGKSFTRATPGNPGSRFVNVNVAIFECESTGGSEWVLEDTIRFKNVGVSQSGDAAAAAAAIDLGPLYDTSLRNKRTVDTLIKKLGSGGVPGEEGTVSQPAPSLKRLLSVPSYTTLQSLKHIISQQGNQCLLSQKSLVQLDWVSTEDGTHVLTVTVGSQIILFTPVSTDIAQANLQAMKASKSGRRPLLKQVSSMAAPLLQAEDIRWMRLRTTHLTTVDGLPPLPMQMSWVRDGILVVGMDNEMHIYSQWRSEVESKEEGKEQTAPEMMTENRILSEQGLLSHAQEACNLRLPTPVTGSMPRTASATAVSGDAKRKRDAHVEHPLAINDSSDATWTSLPDFGIFEASRLACPVLPQYHPKQLMELLPFGKIRRVKAILSHLVDCLSQMDSEEFTTGQTSTKSVGEESEPERSPRSWSRSRTLSIAASPGQPSPIDPEGGSSVPVIAEEVQLDYMEITSIPPLPLFILMEADKDATVSGLTVPSKVKEMTKATTNGYDDLFESKLSTVEESLDEILGERLSPARKKDSQVTTASLDRRRKQLGLFGPKQAQLLTKLLTHSHLPGLSSLDQMHLLALADTVASFNTAFADHFQTDNVKQESLDDCGLRFLLAMRHHTYLLRCLPLVQRAQLQKQGLGSHSIVWAFHSETQEELLDLIPSVKRGNPRWSELRELGIGWWVRNNAVLKKLMEKVAKAAFQMKNDPLDAALFYLAMKRKNLVWGLFRSIQDKKMTDFFQNNFTTEKWRKSALKNAFALLGKQRFEHAAAFFLLAGSVKDAVEVCLNKLDDLQLAMVIVRLYEGDLETTPPSLVNLLNAEILGYDLKQEEYDPEKAHPDPFLRSMAHWLMQNYSQALTTLLETDIGQCHPRYPEDDLAKSHNITANPSVFNFYLYLRTHPLLVRRKMAETAQEKKKAKAALLAGFKYNSDSFESPTTLQVPGMDAITPLERRLFFTTAHAHFRAGCPALALEVLSRLPNKVVLDDTILKEGGTPSTMTKESSIDAQKDKEKGSSALDFDWSQPITTTTQNGLDFDWSTPVSLMKEEPPLDTKITMNGEHSSDEEGGIEMKPSKKDEAEKSLDSRVIKLDIMAQQLKFIACLKIMMEELSTLATGFEVDGGQLRYQLYVWLERSVSSLRNICNYSSIHGMGHAETGSEASMGASVDIPRSEESSKRSPSQQGGETGDVLEGGSGSDVLPTLHEILLADKLDFEAKLQRAARRKQWLKANEALLRTLLSYCSLHGAHGGGLASVRMELVLLLQELQQDRSQQQLLSPLPFPTTLPLLAASVACQKTVIADPIMHLQAMTHDILQTILEIQHAPSCLMSNYVQIVVLRDLSISLSACIYQSLCDSDNFNIKQGRKARTATRRGIAEYFTSSVVFQNSHLLAGHAHRALYSNNNGEEPLVATTAPLKWPGVQSLIALMARDKDEDSPKLHTLLCEAFVAVYLSQLVHAMATKDCHVLYRLMGQKFTERTWSALFGGGTKRLLRVAATASVQKNQPTTPEGGGSGEASLLNSLALQRMKFHMKILGQLSASSVHPNIKEDRPTYREQFVPPQMSMISCFMSKPKLADELQAVDYDSSESLPSDEEDQEYGEDEEDDVFGTERHGSMAGKGRPLSEEAQQEILAHETYSWGILRFAIIKLAHHMLCTFLTVAGIDLPDLPVTSPMLHAVMKVAEIWMRQVKEELDAFGGPPANFLPDCHVESSHVGPAILKYKALLELHNTPFRSNSQMAARRLWNFLVRQEEVQDIFIRYIFSKKRTPAFQNVEVTDEDDEDAPLDPIRIIHKDQDSISAFCVKQVNSGVIALSTPKEIQELDISVLLEPVPWLEEEAEYDILVLAKSPDTIPLTDYLVVQHPTDKIGSPGSHHPGGGPGSASSAYGSPTGPMPTHTTPGRGSSVMKGHHFPGSTNPQFCQFVLERSRHMLKPLKRHKIEGVRRMCAHHHLPLYLSGSQDGAVRMWEWGHHQAIATPRPPGTFAKVTKILFNPHGNKFGVTDGDGNLILWQVDTTSTSNTSFFNSQCHTKQASDFAFLGSSSLIVTAGYSAENKNVCLWDTLLPTKKSLVTAFTCHDQGSSAVLYAPMNQVVISGGKKGDVCIFDMRQRQLRHKFQAHESAVKCMALDPAEEFYITGSADGDIKIWGLAVHILFYSFPGEHSRSTIFRNIGMGVSQVHVDEAGRLFSCGADGSLKLRQLPDRDAIVKSFY